MYIYLSLTGPASSSVDTADPVCIFVYIYMRVYVYTYMYEYVCVYVGMYTTYLCEPC